MYLRTNKYSIIIIKYFIIIIKYLDYLKKTIYLCAPKHFMT